MRFIISLFFTLFSVLSFAQTWTTYNVNMDVMGKFRANKNIYFPQGADSGKIWKCISTTTGEGQWQDGAAELDSNQFWKIHGNSGTNDATNFIGTTDNQDLRFRVNNTNMGRLEYDSRNVAFGRQSMNAVTTGDFNASFGNRSLLALTTGTQNVAIGGTSLVSIKTGSYNTAIGYDTDAYSDSADHTVIIGHGARVGCDSCIVIGDSSTHTYAGFGTSFPTEKLHVHGSIRMVDGNEAAGYVMKSDANGVGSWQSAAVDSSQIVGTILTDKGGTGLTSYTQGDLIYYNSGTSFSKLAKNTTATRYISNTGSSNNPAWAQVDLTNGVTGVLPSTNGGCDAWVDYSGTSTVTGWSSFTQKEIQYQQCYKNITYHVYVSGTSNATTATITIPTGPAAALVQIRGIAGAINNGVGISGRWFVSGGSTTITWNADDNGGAFTGSGTKAVFLDVTFKTD